MATLDEFESRLRSLLELQLLKRLPGYRAEDGIAQQLAATLRKHLKVEPGVTLAPNLFVIIAHPSTLARWQTKPRFLKELANALFTAGKEAGFHFSLKPTVTTTADASLSIDDLRIVASFSEENITETQGISLERVPPGSAAETPDSDAYFILGGKQIIPLNRSVMNIGRRLDNHVVLDDPRVSRNHAQLRLVKDEYVLFDLNSSGGTFVNGHRTNQAVLHPGDVISLAGVSLIFGQDLPSGHNLLEGQTEPGTSLSVDPNASFPEENGPTQ